MAPVALKFCLNPVAKARLLKHEATIINQVMQQGKHKGIVPLLHTYLTPTPPVSPTSTSTAATWPG